jgi:DNA gyrase inhibitor GyrI
MLVRSASAGKLVLNKIKENEMNELEVQIVKLEAMRVASALGFGESPEHAAAEMMLAWAKAENLLPSTFGFNNPNPSPGSPNYGYEIWLPVGQEVKASGDIKIKEFSGGLYAVARCESLTVIGEVWQALVQWREGSKYEEGHHQWLEKLLVSLDAPADKLVFDLYLPIAE